MHWIDWTIVISCLLFVAYIGFRTQGYVKGVTDFLVGNRVAGRYVLAVAVGAANVGLISLVANFEIYYKSGFAYGFWGTIALPVSIVIALTGYCIYRYRETRAMTMGQFLEIRYSRSFRIFGAILQSISGVINYGIFPAVGARFIVYFCNLPLNVNIYGWVFPTFVLLMAGFLGLAVLIVTLGGQVTVMATDCIQGILSYPMYVVVVVFILWKFSWHGEMVPSLLDRPVGQSMLNPYDITELRDFNIFFVCVGIFGSIINVMSWSGTQGYTGAAANAHEQKMGSVLGSWRAGFSTLMVILLAVAGFTFLNHTNYSEPAREVRRQLAHKAMYDIAREEKFAQVRTEVDDYLQTGKVGSPLQKRVDRVIAEKLQEEQEDISTELSKEPQKEISRLALESEDKGVAQGFEAIFGQMRVPLTLRAILPTGIAGVFCAIMIFLMISTDTTYLHSWGSIMVQDLIVPFRKTPFTPRQQLRLLRLFIAGVAVFAFFFSYFFGQVDYIMMFMTITGAIWVGGAGVCIVGGLYWKRGTTAGAWASLICGSSLAIAGIIGQKYWVEYIYPWLVKTGRIDSVRHVIERISDPFRPIIDWRVTGDKFPINSQEIFFVTMVAAVGLYVVLGLLGRREPFNMERMLHRGKYRVEGEEQVKERLTPSVIFRKLIGITSEYTKGDRILAWSVLLFMLGWTFGSWLIIVVWNFIYPWPNEWWATWFSIQFVYVPLAIGVVSTVWFTIGGTWDLRRMFKRLAKHEADILDDGRVVGHISAADVALVEKVENVTIKEAHESEKALAEELRREGQEDAPD